MGNSLRCCLACVLPCGALDLIRIVHLNGHVEEITGPVTAGEILRANPDHVLSKPSSQGVDVRRILIISPDSQLKRGSIYFLIPASSSPEKKKSGDNNNNNKSSHGKSSRKSKRCHSTADVSNCDRLLIVRDVVSRKNSSSRHDRRRSGRAGVWRPHLQSISED